MAQFGITLFNLRRSADLTQQQLADKLTSIGEAKITRSAVGMWEAGKRIPKFEVLETIADFFNVDMDYLTGRSDIDRKYSSIGSIFPDNIIPMPKMDKVPLIGTIACGEPILAEENIEGQVDLPDHIQANFALRCKGDSMIEARIHDGDVVYIRQQEAVDNGQIAAVLIGDEATLKRVYFYPETGKLVLSPANPAYEPFVYTGEEISSVRILGKAVAFTSTVK